MGACGIGDLTRMLSKRISVAILTANKIDFKTRKMTRDKEGDCLIIKGSVLPEDNNSKCVCT